MDSEIIKFYKGEPNASGITIDDFWTFDRFELERCHGYIQWVFPNVEPSMFNKKSQTLTEEDIKEFKTNQKLRQSILLSFDKFLVFLGLQVKFNGVREIPEVCCPESFTVKEISKGVNYDSAKSNWQTKRNHNYLRITRIINFLNIVDFKDVARAFYDFIMTLVAEVPEKFNETTLEYWDAAINEREMK